MRWKAFFFDKNENQDKNDDEEEDDDKQSHKFGFKSRKCPPQIEDMEKFEEDLLDMVQNIKFRRVDGLFQNTLKEDIKKIRNSDKAFIFAYKTTNLYKVDKTQCDKLLRDSITSTKKKADDDWKEKNLQWNLNV